MQFVAFDLESTDGYFSSGNICEFGYCIADEKFNIIEQRNILIRPISKVNNAYYRLKLAYPLKLYYSSPSFVENYAKIGTILQKSNCVVLGHAIHNDIVGINSACKINTLPAFNFCFVDTQVLYSIFKKMPTVCSLVKIAEEIGVTFNHHRADEDAKLSLFTLKYICEKEGLTFNQLMAAYEATIGINCDGVITNFVSSKCLSQGHSLTSKNSKRRILSMFKPKAVDEDKIDKTNPLYRKKVFISRDILLEDIDVTRAMFNRFAELGAKSVNFVNNCDYYIGEITDEANFKGQVLSLDEFLPMLGELEILHYDDKAILEEYNREKERRRELEAIAKLNEKNKNATIK